VWLQKNAGMTREEAVAWGRQQQQAGVIENLGKGEFDYAELFFRFAKAGTSGASDPEKEKLNKVRLSASQPLPPPLPPRPHPASSASPSAPSPFS
jgi:hypothetical protein